MGLIGFVDDEESRPSTNNSKKCKLTKKILGDCGAVNYVSVPRKLRSAIKKRARESIAPPLPNLGKNEHLSNGVATLKKSAKKSKLNKKQKRLTKDEKEVAETLYALADMFSDASCNTNKLALDVETKSSTIIEDNGIPTPVDEKISTEDSLEAICHSSNLVDSTELVQQPKLPSMKESEDRINWGAFQSSSILPASGDSSSKKQLPPWLKNANSTSSQPRANSNTVTITADKSPRFHDVKSKNSWKRCSAHVYISRLIKVLQITEKERKDECGLLGRPSQSRTNGDAQLRPSVTNNNQIKEERKNINIVPLRTRQLFEDQQQLVSKTSSTKLVTDFLSLGHNHHEAPRNYQASSCLQSQISSTFSLPWNNFQGSTSDVAVARQVPPYLNNISTMAQWGHQHQQQQKRIMIPLLQNKYNNRGGATLAEWQHPNALLNYTHPFPPHLGSKYYSQQQQQQLMAISSSRLDHQHRL